MHSSRNPMPNSVEYAIHCIGQSAKGVLNSMMSSAGSLTPTRFPPAAHRESNKVALHINVQGNESPGTFQMPK